MYPAPRIQTHDQPSSEIVQHLVLAHRRYLAAHGFELVGAACEGNPGEGPQLIYHFFNSRNKMKLDLSFFPGGTTFDGGFAVSILKADEQRFDLNTYLSTLGFHHFGDFFTYREQDGDFCQFAEAFFDTLNNLLSIELRPLLTDSPSGESLLDG